MSSLVFHKFIYPEHVINDQRPPQCLFVPEQDMLIKIIETTMKYSFMKRKLLLSKFSDIEVTQDI